MDHVRSPPPLPTQLAQVKPLDHGDDVKKIHDVLTTLGFAIPNSEREAQFFGSATRDAVASVQAKAQLLVTGAVDDRTAAALNQLFGSVNTNNYSVSGRVATADGEPIEGLVLIVSVIGLGGAIQSRGKTTTNKLGYFTIPFPWTSQNPPVVQLTTYNSDGKDYPLTNSTLQHERHVLLDVTAPSWSGSKDTEYKRLVDAIKPHLGDLPLDSLKEDDKRRDLSILVEKTGWDARLLQLGVTAANLAKTTKLSAPVVYSLLRQQVPSDPSSLARMDPAALQNAMTNACEAGIVNLSQSERASAEKTFTDFALKVREKTRANGTVSSLGELLDVPGLDEASNAAVKRLFAKHGQDPATFWSKAKEAVGQAGLPALTLHSKLAYLTANNESLIKAVGRKLGTGQDVRSLVDLGFYKPSAWGTTLDAVAASEGKNLGDLIPPVYTQDTDTGRRDAYAQDLARTVRLSFPTGVLRAQVTSGAFGDLGGLASDVAEALNKAEAEGVEIGSAMPGTQRLSRFFANHGTELLPDPVKRDAVRNHLLTMQRLHQITPSDASLTALHNLGLYSAHDVAAFDLPVFQARFGDKLPADEIELIHLKAQQVVSISSTMVAMVKQVASLPSLAVMSPSRGSPDGKDRGAARKSLIQQSPTLERLFGSLDFCPCESCQSIFSPMAYFVDVLKYLDPEPQVWQSNKTAWQQQHGNAPYPGGTPYEELLARRPDLAYLPLTCANTNTELPYIDIVNEILEYYVAHNQLGGAAAHDTSPLVTSDNLIAEPQNLITEAYDQLATSTQPPPFDLGLEHVRTFVTQLNTPWYSVLEAFRTDPADFATFQTVALEMLGLGPTELAPLSRLTDDVWFQFYGFTTADDAVAELFTQAKDGIMAKKLARLLGVTYQDLVDLVRTQYINPDLSALVYLRKAGLNEQDVMRYKQGLLGLDDTAAFEQRLKDLVNTYPSFDPEILNRAWTEGVFKRILVLTNPSGGCLFDNVVMRFADGQEKLDGVLARLSLMTRLATKLGWSFNAVDGLLHTCMPANEADSTKRLLTALVCGAQIQQLAQRLSMRRDDLFALYADIQTVGIDPLYEQLFLAPGILKADKVFDDPLGRYLQDSTVQLDKHIPGVQAALDHLTVEGIAAVLGPDYVQQPLVLDTVSNLYRHAMLARALDIKVEELVRLKGLMAVDPFQLPVMPAPNTTKDLTMFFQTLYFVESVESLKGVGLEINVLDTLVHHNIDLAGPLGDLDAVPELLLRRLSQALRQADIDTTFPAGDGPPTADVMRTKLAVILTPDVLETFIGMYTGTREFEADSHDTNLDGNVYKAEKRLSVRDGRYLVYRGIVTPAVATRLKQAFSGPPHEALIDDLAGQAKGLVDSLLSPMLKGADLDKLFPEAPDAAALAQQRNYIVGLVQPWLRTELRRRAVVGALNGVLGTNSGVLDALITDAGLLVDGADQPLIQSLSQMAQAGLTVTFSDAGGNPVGKGITLASSSLLASDMPTNTKSIHFRTLFDVPTDSALSFLLICQTNIETTLLINGQAVALQGTPLVGQKQVLASGTLHLFDLVVTFTDATPQLTDISIQVESSVMMRAPLASLSLYPAAAAESVQYANILLRKTLYLLTTLNLEIDDLRVLLLHEGKSEALKWPTTHIENTADAQALFTRIAQMVIYASLKQPSGGDVLRRFLTAASPAQHLAAATAAYPQDTAAISPLIDYLRLGLPPSLNDFRRLTAALAILRKLGTSVADITRWLSGSVSIQTARNVRDVLRAHFTDAQWRIFARPVFDGLRKRQRDALVAYILQKLGLSTIEELFELFLLDAGMEPVVLTSRLQLATASVQTFIQRCFLNIEPRVAASVLNASQWNWMKRYRVWEANRRILFYPENWLEPELRDDVTHLFSATLGALLQTDVTTDLVEQALSDYLRGLEMIARLEIASTYYETRPGSTGVTHLLSRTHTKPAKYFYRTYANEMWTPWVPVNAKIDSNHVAVVKWRDRVHVFWVSFVLKPVQQGSTSTFRTLADESPRTQQPPRAVQAQLSWIEYTKGKWAEQRTTGYLDTDARVSNVDDIQVTMHIKTDGATITFYITGDVSLTIPIRSKLAPVVPTLREEASSFPVGHRLWDFRFPAGMMGYGALTVIFDPSTTDSSQSTEAAILGALRAGFVTPPVNAADLSEDLLAPFFLQDDDHTLFVQPTMSYVPVWKWDWFGFPPLPPPPIWIPPSIPLIPQKPLPKIPIWKLPPQPDPLPDLLKQLPRDLLKAKPIISGMNPAVGFSLTDRSSELAASRATELSVVPFHSYSDLVINLPIVFPTPFGHVEVERRMSYAFDTHEHPFAPALMQRLVTNGIGSLQAADTETASVRFFETDYVPTALVKKNESGEPYPIDAIDFDHRGAYAGYNWEIFFHVPLTIAIQLQKNGRYEEARQWFHYIFDPTDTSNEPVPERYWRLKVFKASGVEQIEDALLSLATGDQTVLACIQAWRDNPFRPHLIARYRPVAYMLKTVMAYLDNLIAWGDSLFRQDTREAINDATQLYILAANLLGPRPSSTPAMGKLAPATYNSLRKDLNAMSDALRDLEADIPFDMFPSPSASSSQDNLDHVQSVGRALYFCVPPNGKLLGYWDTVADRLYKIRNSLNLMGIFRQLPLFAPPIDPGLLAAAVAAGLDVAAIAAGAQQPLPLVRFPALLPKATEICSDVKALGGQLLSAIEKEDGERLAVLRATHERDTLERAEVIKYGQLQEAKKATEGLKRSFTTAVMKYSYYEQLLGRKPADIKIAEIDDLDVKALLDMSLTATENEVSMRNVPITVVEDLTGTTNKLSKPESTELSKLTEARNLQAEAGNQDETAADVGKIPDFSINFQPWGIGMSTSAGGSTIAKFYSSGALSSRHDADGKTYDAAQASKTATYSRREQEWTHQSNLAASEINQSYKQLRGAQIREALAKREWENHQQQIENARTIENFLTNNDPKGKGKVTNEAFYTWMKGEVRSLYGRGFDLAFEVAKKAERALQHELGDSSLRYLSNAYADAGHEGLLSGERLFADLKKMEQAYIDQNRRELELTKHVSLLSLDPRALLALRTAGTCTVSLPESLFDMDGPGQYFRRLKTVALSIPCVAGPYATVSCKLTLQKSSIRTSANLLQGKYERGGDEDSRFSDYYGTLESVVTSSGMNDGGLFETNLHDERYLPFEGHGAVSTWSLELPTEVRQFDYTTIADAILHVRYTARDAGQPLGGKALGILKKQIEQAKAGGSARLFSIRHEFPSAWAAFKATKPTTTQRVQLGFELTQEHYPYWSTAVPAMKVLAASLYARASTNTLNVFDKAGKIDTLSVIGPSPPLLHLLMTPLEKTRAAALPDPVGTVSLYFEDNTMTDLWLIVDWGGAPAAV